MSGKRIFFGCGIALLVGVMLIGILYLCTIGKSIVSIFPNPPKPEIKYGEFPISITYEVNGEIKVLEDVVICQFDGFERLGEAGTYRKWKSHLKSGNTSLVFLPVEQDDITVEIGIFRGSPNYYMGDFKQSREEYERTMADDRYRGYYIWENGGKTGQPTTKEEVWEKYKLKILDVHYSPPIQNSFK